MEYVMVERSPKPMNEDAIKRVPGYTNPFQVLLILEWILLGIAILTIFTPMRMPHPRHGAPHEFRGALQLVSLGIVISLGLLGLRLPPPSRVVQIAYIALGFGMSWLVVLVGGRGLGAFPALLLVVVMRACLLFPWGGRILVAGFAYGSFLILQVMALLGMRLFGVPLGRSLPRAAQQLPPEMLRSVVAGLTVNAAILFGLVLVFVLLLVSTVLSEYRNRQALATANQRLRDYALVVENQATLQERTRIAREIHDSVGHALAAQSIQLENVAVTLAARNVETATHHLQTARRLGREALQNVRQSVASLRTNPLMYQTLPQAIATLVEEFQRTHSIAVDAHLPAALLLTEDQKIALYRITQEALTNIVKHSQAKHIRLQIGSSGSRVSLSIQDDGQGFNPDANTTGFGLQSMRERTTALGGSFTLKSHPGNGCQILITVPLKQHATDDQPFNLPG
ncbi:MAG: sensor histidine kinase [Cyanobacteria bacterium P01_E01_bin.6]